MTVGRGTQLPVTEPGVYATDPSPTPGSRAHARGRSMTVAALKEPPEGSRTRLATSTEAPWGGLLRDVAAAKGAKQAQKKGLVAGRRARGDCPSVWGATRRICTTWMTAGSQAQGKTDNPWPHCSAVKFEHDSLSAPPDRRMSSPVWVRSRTRLHLACRAETYPDGPCRPLGRTALMAARAETTPASAMHMIGYTPDQPRHPRSAALIIMCPSNVGSQEEV